MPKALVTGAGGLIGSYVVREAAQCAPGWTVRGLRRADMDLTNYAALCALFADFKPDAVIHCAALTNTPLCEAEPDRARLLNVDVTARICELAAAIPLVFISTDLVFDGTRGNYSETDKVNPLGVYAQTKAEAERIVLTNSRHIVIRTSLNAGVSPTGDRSVTEKMRMAWRAGQTLRLFTDEYRCPIHASLTARAIWELLRQGQAGLFHIAGAQKLSRWELGQLVAARCPELNPRLEPASIKQWAGPPRAADTSLDCSKAQAALSFPLLGLEHWLKSHPSEPF
ncbi:MAG: SDR family oxidoreductase [Verrucomicrobiae bacterium]|nr:SDR family oxidoreductase [Verrucomicrobiae bacterium]